MAQTAAAILVLCAIPALPWMPRTASAQATKAEVEVEVGGAAIRIPIPQGFASAAARPEVMFIGDALTPTHRRLLAFLVAAEDLAPEALQKASSLTQTFSVQTAPNSESQTLTPEAFVAVKAKARQQFDRLVQTANPDATHLAQILEQLSANGGQAAKLEIDKIVPVGVVEESPTSITMCAVSKSTVGLGEQHREDFNVSAITIATVREKPLWLVTRRAFRSEDDIRVNTEQVRAWVSAIREANR